MEKSLEEKYLDYCVLVCPLEQSRSISQYFRRSGLFAPTRFLDLDQSVYEFSLFLVSRTTKFSEADVKEYLLWKIWQHKLANINAVESELGQLRVASTNKLADKESHKILGRAKKLLKEAKEFQSFPELEQFDFKERFEKLVFDVINMNELIRASFVENPKLIEGK